MINGAPHNFAPAKWITAPPGSADSLPLFRQSFRLPDPEITRAVARLCGLGQFELRINGRKVGEDVLEPAWTNYSRTCSYITRDVAAFLRRGGENVIGVMLGNGMYNVTGNRYKKFKASFGPPKLLLHLQIDFADGATQAIVTDRWWKSCPGPVTFSCIYGGEDYDARLEQDGWDSPGFDDARWQAVDETTGPGGALTPQISPPIRVMQKFKPVKVTRPKPGILVYDLGQNFSGWPAISTRAQAAQTIKMTTGELLDDAGIVSQKNTGSPVYFSYTTAGHEAETWHPRFSYTGFRYVQVEGGEPSELEGQFIHSSAAVVGHFSCSDPLLNRIHELINAAILSNMQSVLTDCPHREKLGWLEQAHLMGPAIMFNYDVSRLFAKICRDMREAQRPDGCVPTIAPEYVVFKDNNADFSNSPEWGSAAVIVPWLVYQQYGHRQILEDNYELMRRYVEYLHTRETDGIIDFGLGDWYDIGPGEPGHSKLTSKGLTGTAIYYQDITIVQRVAALLGNTDDAARYAAWTRRIGDAFNRRFFSVETKSYDRGSQTAQAMPLALGLVNPEDRAAVLNHLIADIRGHDNHITAGDIGFRYVLQALVEAGRSDVIFELLSRTDPPSYGAQLARGATTLTEAWDANPKNSQNHLMLGHAELWFYQSLAGIQIDLSKPPDQQIVIAPQIVGDIIWTEARYESIVGTIRSRWERSGDHMKLDITVPINTTAMVHLPDGSTRHVGSGSHTFESPLNRR